MAEESTAKRRLITIAALLGLIAVQTLVAIIYKVAQKNGKYTFSTASALTMAEFIKIWLSFGLHVKATGWKDAKTEMVANMKKAPYIQLILLALSYFVNNHLNFYLFLWADPVSITVMKSGASFITAILSWIVLAKLISKVQWSAILLQVAGLCLLQYDPCLNSTTLKLSGYFVMFISVTIASANGIWNERLLKSYDCSLNIQNMILYMAGTVFNFLLFLSNSSEMGFFQGYDVPAVIIVFLNAVIGLTITVIYKYTNAIAKTFCSAVATVVLFIVNATLFNLPASLNSVLSCIVVFVATYLYTQGAVPATATPATTTNGKEYDKLPTSELEVEEEPVQKSKLAKVFGKITARRIGGLLFAAVIIASLVISFRSVTTATPAAGPVSNDTVIAPTSTPTEETPIAIAEPPRTAATAMLRKSDLSEIVLPPQAPYFDDILVILHFNYPRYNHLPILLEQYGKVFKNLLVCGQEPHPMIDYVCTKDQVHNGGHTMYSCIADIMEASSTNYSGYMSFHFDLFVNYWNIYGLDKNKTWITNTGSRDNEGPFSLAKLENKNPSGWGWWGTKWGMAAVKKAMPNVPAEYRIKMNESLGANDMFYRGMGDLFYVPQRLRTEFISLSRTFLQAEVFLEIAVPTIAVMMELPEKPIELSGTFDWGGKNFAQFWHKEHHFGHPFHFHVAGMYDLFRKSMSIGYNVNITTAA